MIKKLITGILLYYIIGLNTTDGLVGVKIPGGSLDHRFSTPIFLGYDFCPIKYTNMSIEPSLVSNTRGLIVGDVIRQYTLAMGLGLPGFLPTSLDIETIRQYIRRMFSTGYKATISTISAPLKDGSLITVAFLYVNCMILDMSCFIGNQWITKSDFYIFDKERFGFLIYDPSKNYMPLLETTDIGTGVCKFNCTQGYILTNKNYVVESTLWGGLPFCVDRNKCAGCAALRDKALTFTGPKTCVNKATDFNLTELTKFAGSLWGANRAIMFNGASFYETPIDLLISDGSDPMELIDVSIFGSFIGNIPQCGIKFMCTGVILSNNELAPGSPSAFYWTPPCSPMLGLLPVANPVYTIVGSYNRAPWCNMTDSTSSYHLLIGNLPTTVPTTPLVCPTTPMTTCPPCPICNTCPPLATNTCPLCPPTNTCPVCNCPTSTTAPLPTCPTAPICPNCNTPQPQSCSSVGNRVLCQVRTNGCIGCKVDFHDNASIIEFDNYVKSRCICNSIPCVSGSSGLQPAGYRIKRAILNTTNTVIDNFNNDGFINCLKNITQIANCFTTEIIAGSTVAICIIAGIILLFFYFCCCHKFG